MDYGRYLYASRTTSDLSVQRPLEPLPLGKSSKLIRMVELLYHECDAVPGTLVYYRLREAERGSHKAHTDRYHIILRCALCRASVMHLGHLALQLAEATVSRFMEAQSLSMIIAKVMRVQVQEGRKLWTFYGTRM